MKSSDLKQRKTKIIATIGPASNSEKAIKELILAGVDIFRLNASHSADPLILGKCIKSIRKIADQLNHTVGIFLDLQGPKIRVGQLKEDFVMLKAGDFLTIHSDKILGTKSDISVSYKGFIDDVNIDDPLFIDDGKIKLIVKSKTAKTVVCKISLGGKLSSRKGINLPQTEISISAMTEKDKKDTQIALDNNLEYIALSFVSHARDVKNLRKYLDKRGGKSIKIIAKLERQLALDNIKDIIKSTDAVMVARGDLGVEINIEHVPKAQKEIINLSNRFIKPVIVATQMLESMITATTATRAEASDVANAVYDHCDAVMLSGETAIGVSPETAVKTMATICSASDKHLCATPRSPYYLDDRFEEKSRPTSICKAADKIAEENKARVIMAFTSSGNTPLIASKLNSVIPIISPTDDETVYRQMALFRGVIPLLMPTKFKDINSWTEMIEIAVNESKKRKLVKEGDVIVVTAGIPIGESNGINSIRLITID